MAQYFENRGTLRELTTFPIDVSQVELSSSYNGDRGKNINWVKPKSTLSAPVAVFADNVFWKNTTVCFMVKSLKVNQGAKRQTLISYVDNESRNVFEIFTSNGKVFLSSQMVYIDISMFDWEGEHFFTVTRDWDTGLIRVWQDKTQILAAYFIGSDYAIESEDKLSVLANEPDTAIIIVEPSVISRSALDRTKSLYFFGSEEKGVEVPDCYIGDFHIWDWAIEQDDVDMVYDTSTIIMSVDRMTRYLGEFKSVPPLARLGDSFKWVSPSNEMFQNGQVYWLTKGGWSLLKDNAEYVTTGV